MVSIRHHVTRVEQNKKILKIKNKKVLKQRPDRPEKGVCIFLPPGSRNAIEINKERERESNTGRKKANDSKLLQFKSDYSVL